MQTSSTLRSFPVLWVDVLFWYSSSSLLPSEIEDAWKKANPDFFAQLMAACKNVQPRYDAYTDAEAANAALTDANTMLLKGGAIRAEFGANTYKPGGLGHGGSARILKADGTFLESTIVVNGAKVRARPILQVRIGAATAPATDVIPTSQA